MKTKLLFHPLTRKQLNAALKHPPQALLLTGHAGVGKGSIIRWLAAKLLSAPLETISEHPYIKWIRTDGKSTSIDEIRSVERFLSLKVPSTSQINRLIIIEQAESLTHEAQNALLKTLEEPPEATVIIMSATSEETLLPTVRSRLARISIKSPPIGDLKALYEAEYSQAAVDQAAAISNGLPGLMKAVLSEADHELMPAIAEARALLGGNSYERLLAVDVLAKDRKLTENTLFILQQMAEVQLRKPGSVDTAQWSRILQAAYKADQSIKQSGQLKLVMTDLLLNLR